MIKNVVINNLKRTTFLVLVLLFSNSYSQSVLGKWKTIDDESGKVQSVVEIYKEGTKLYGKIIKIYPEPGDPEDPVCDKCTDHRKGQRIIGMKIISGLSQDGDVWKKDDGILDPKKGKLYDCRIWLETENKLAVRGYIGFFYRTQYWIRLD